MPRRPRGRTLSDRRAALETERARLFDSPAMRADIDALRYGLSKAAPLPFADGRHFEAWAASVIRSGAAEKLTALQEGIAALRDKHKIPARWARYLSELALYGQALTDAPIIFEQVEYDPATGKWRLDATETDLYSPESLEALRQAQRWVKRRNDPIPAPIEDPKTERLDWRPVWEWYKRTPGATLEEIAEALTYAPQTVRRALAKLGLEWQQ